MDAIGIEETRRSAVGTPSQVDIEALLSGIERFQAPTRPIPLSAQVPFAEEGGGITGLGQHLGNRDFVASQSREFMRHADHTHADPAAADRGLVGIAVLALELAGLFVEDADLLSVAGLPFARQVGAFSAGGRRLDPGVGHRFSTPHPAACGPPPGPPPRKPPPFPLPLLPPARCTSSGWGRPTGIPSGKDCSPAG